jgi:hypothetical protein
MPFAALHESGSGTSLPKCSGALCLELAKADVPTQAPVPRS